MGDLGDLGDLGALGERSVLKLKWTERATEEIYFLDA